jgi:hypothetical protein
MTIKQFGVREVADLVLYDVVTGKPVLRLDTLKMTSLTSESETAYATGGKGNSRLLTFDYNKTATFAVSNALMNPKSIAMQNGTEVVKGSEIVSAREELMVVAGKVTVANTIVGNVTVFAREDEFGIALSETHTGALITLDALEAQDGDAVIVYYDFEAENAETIKISSDKFGGFYKAVGFTVVRDTNGQDVPFQIVMPKVKISSGFAFEMTPDGDPTAFDFELEVLKGEGTTDMVKLVKFGA